MKYVALLRGINVGGKNMLPMKDLTALFGAAGAENVQTYIQSGNVIFEASASVAAELPDLIAILGTPIFDQCAPDEQRILLAVLERLAAEHYVRWADGLSDPSEKQGPPVIGTLSVVTKDVPSNAVAGGAPVRVLRMREAPRTMRWA